MKNISLNISIHFLLIIFFSTSLPQAWAQNSKSITYQVIYKSDQKSEVRKLGSGPFYLELGEKVKGVLLKGDGDFRLSQQTQSSVTVMNEGPHLDLLNWKHGISPWVILKKSDGLFLYQEQFIEKDFPKVSKEELLKAVHKEGGERWVETAKGCKDPGSYPCGIAPSLYLFKVEQKVEGKWQEIGKISLYPPMGC